MSDEHYGHDPARGCGLMLAIALAFAIVAALGIIAWGLRTYYLTMHGGS